jgi:hypothetical protein
MSVVAYPNLPPTPTEVEYNHAIEYTATGGAGPDDTLMAEPSDNTSRNQSVLGKRKELTIPKPSGFAGVIKERFSSRKPTAVLRNMGSAMSSDEAESSTAGARRDQGKGVATNPGASAAESSTAAATKRGDDGEDTLFVDEENLYSSGSSDDEPHENESAAEKKARHAHKRAAKAKMKNDDEVGYAAQRNVRHEVKRAKEQLDRIRLENDGKMNYAEYRSNRRRSVPRPKLVEKQWSPIYQLVKGWWKEGGRVIPKSHLASIRKADKAIESWCKVTTRSSDNEEACKRYDLILAHRVKRLEQNEPTLSEEDKKTRIKLIADILKRETGAETAEGLYAKYKFPIDLLHGQINELGKLLKDVNELPSTKWYQDEIAKLVTSIASPENGADLQKSQDEKKAKELALEASRNMRMRLFQGYEVFLDLLYKLDIAPASITNEGTRSNFMNIAETDGNAEFIQRVRNEMERPTLEQESDWTVAAQPLVEFVRIINSEVAHTQRTETKANDLLELIRERNSSIQDANDVNDVDSDVNTLPMAILQELQTVWTEGNREQVAQKYNALKDLLKSRELGSIILQVMDNNEHFQGADSASPESDLGSDDPPRLHGQRAHTSNSPPSISQSLPSANNTTLAEENLLNLDLDSMTMPSDNIEVFAYEDGKTEYGPLVATRACSSDNPRFSRFVVNSGLDEIGFEYFRVVKGSDLAPGGAESLKDQNVVDFDLRQRKKDLKTSPLSAIGPCVVMPRSEGYVRRGTKARQPDTYIKVTYTGELPDEWLSRTEFIQLAGKKFAERQFAILVPAYQKRQKYFEACKAQRKHPRTKQLLTQQDFENSPWLFPDGVNRNDVNGNDEAGEDMDED